MAQDVIPSIAERYRISVDAAREIERALQSSGGRQAQFNHPELGGFGQWSAGMIQIGKMNDRQLRQRVEGLCAEIAAIVRGEETSATAALSRDPDSPPAGACVGLAAGESWWPAQFGHAGASGEQNGVRYAYFPARHHLLVQAGGRVCVYDTRDRDITGMSQQQGTSSSLVFHDARGDVALDQLECMSMEQAIG